MSTHVYADLLICIEVKQTFKIIVTKQLDWQDGDKQYAGNNAHKFSPI